MSLPPSHHIILHHSIILLFQVDFLILFISSHSLLIYLLLCHSITFLSPSFPYSFTFSHLYCLLSCGFFSLCIYALSFLLLFCLPLFHLISLSQLDISFFFYSPLFRLFSSLLPIILLFSSTSRPFLLLLPLPLLLFLLPSCTSIPLDLHFHPYCHSSRPSSLFPSNIHPFFHHPPPTPLANQSPTRSLTNSTLAILRVFTFTLSLVHSPPLLPNNSQNHASSSTQIAVTHTQFYSFLHPTLVPFLIHEELLSPLTHILLQSLTHPQYYPHSYYEFSRPV